MKLLMIGFLALFSLGAFANSKEYDKMPFEQQKQMKLQKLDKKSAVIQASRSCVNAAKDKGDLRECGEEMKEKQSMMDREYKTKQSQEAVKKSY